MHSVLANINPFEACSSHPDCENATALSGAAVQERPLTNSPAGAEPRSLDQPELITSRDRSTSRDDASGPNSEFDSRERGQTFDINAEDCIPEIFHGASKFARGFDEHSFLDELEEFIAEREDIPLFVVRERARRAA